MSIEILIKGDNATELLGELTTLAAALRGGCTVPVTAAFVATVAEDNDDAVDERENACGDDTTSAETGSDSVVELKQAQTPPPATDAELDADGRPWDGRIDASSKEKLVKTKQWKPKRVPNGYEGGKDAWDAYREQVIAELQDQVADQAPVEQATENAAGEAFGNQQAPAQQPAVNPGAVVTVPQVLQKCVACQNAGLIDEASLAAILQPWGIATMPEIATLAATEGALADIHATLCAMLPA